MFNYFRVPLETYVAYILIFNFFVFLFSSGESLKDIRYTGNNIIIKCFISILINCVILLQVIFVLIGWAFLAGIVWNKPYYSSEELRNYLIPHYGKYIPFIGFLIPTIIMMALEKKTMHNIFTKILYLFNLIFFIIAFSYLINKLPVSLFINNKVISVLFIITLCGCLIGPLFELLREITKGFKTKSEIKKGVIK